MFAAVCWCWLVFLFILSGVSGDDVFTNAFCNVRFKPTFIDKTLLIYEVLNHKQLFINAPSKFGKSVNIGMMNFFLSNRFAKETIYEYFNGTEILKNAAFVKEHLGEHPVILYNATNHGVLHDEDHMKVTFKWTMYNTFLDHEYLLKSPKVSSKNSKMLAVFMDRWKIQSLKVEEVFQGLRLLAQALNHHFGKQAIFLSDGFGNGVMDRIIFDNNDYKYLCPIIVQWYSQIIDHTLNDQTVFSHVLVSGETQLYGLFGPPRNILSNVPFMDKREFSRFFGFTYDELEYLLDKFNIPLDERPQVLKWYCGYSTVDGEVKVCNPYSLLQYLNSLHKNIKPFWYGSIAGPDLIQRMVDAPVYQQHILNLVYSQPLNITLEDITEGVEVLRQQVEELQSDSQNFIFQVLKEVGYLTYSGNPPPVGVSLKFPNEEIRSVIDKFISLLSFI